MKLRDNRDAWNAIVTEICAYNLAAKTDTPIGEFALTDRICDAVDRALTATGPGSGQLAEAIAVLREASAFFGLPAEKADMRKRQVAAVERFDRETAAPQADRGAVPVTDPTPGPRFKPRPAPPRADDTTGPRDPFEPATPPSGSPPGASEATCSTCDGSGFGDATGCQWPDDPAGACPSCGGTGRRPPESPDGSRGTR